MPTYTNRLKLSNPASGECQWDDDWWRNQYIKDALSGQDLQDNSIISGGVLSSPSGLNIDISAVVGSIAGVEYSDPGGTLVLNAAAPDEEQMNWVYMDDIGDIVVSATPITDTDFALIGMVDTDTTSVVRYSDLRRIKAVIVHPDLPGGVIENDCINGIFQIWERATTQTSSGFGSDDRFDNLHVGSTKTHSQQSFTIGQTDVPGNPEFYSRTVVTSSAGSTNFVKKAHKVLDVRKYSGQKVLVKFHAKADTAKNIALEGVQNFGTSGSSTIFGISAQKIALTTSWAKYVAFVDFPSISTKTVGTFSFSGLFFWFDAGSNFDTNTDTLGQQSGTFELSEIEIYVADEEYPVRRRTAKEELALCLPYYNQIVGPGSAAGCRLAAGYVSNPTASYNHFVSPLPMVGTPSLIVSNPNHFSIYSSVIAVCHSVTLGGAQANNKHFYIFGGAETGSGLTAGFGCHLGNSSTSAILALSAEL